MLLVSFRMSKQGGFTLLELLIVLTIISFVALFALPKMYQSLTYQGHRHHLELFSSDIFYIQNQALFTAKSIEIKPNKEKYWIISSTKQTERIYPDDLYLTYYPAKTIFTTRGVLKTPATYTYRHSNGQYTVTFPFGKGREYVTE